MILDTIVAMLFGLLEGVLALIPSYTLPGLGFGAGLGSAVAGANSVFPVVTLGSCVAAVIGLRVLLYAVAVLAWIWDKIPLKFS